MKHMYVPCELLAAWLTNFQGIITPRGHIEQLAEVEGHKIIGTKIRAPFAFHSEVLHSANGECSGDKRHWCRHVRSFRLSR